MSRSYAAVSAAMASASVGQRSVKFLFDEEEIKDYDVVRALLVSFDEEEIERVQAMPGHIWVVVFKNATLAEEATNGFILKERRVRPKLISERFVTATVAYVPPDASMREIEEALERFADVVSFKELYLRDFPGIKNGRQRVILKPREGGLPSFFPIRDYKASLFFTGRISCCPYCEERDHLGRNCPNKKVRRCFTCGSTGHLRRHCPGYARQDNDNNNDNNNNEDRTNNDNMLSERMDTVPSVSDDMAGIAVLSDGESTSSDSSLDTVVETPQDETDNNTTNPATESIIEKAEKKREQDAATAEVLADLFADTDTDTEELTTAEKIQLQQEQQEIQPSPELFPPTDPGTTTEKSEAPENMEINQNLKRKPLTPVDLRQKFGQSPKPRRSPKHKRKKKDKL